MFDKTDAQALTIQISRKIKQMRLDSPLVFAERRINADVSDTRNLSLSYSDDHCVYAVREEHIRAWSQICCRKPKTTTTLEAFFHSPAHGVRTAQQAGHRAHLTGTEHGTYCGAADFSSFN